MFDWLETTAPAIWVGESLWGYPIMLGLHAIGLSIVAGIFIMRDLRLLGFFSGLSLAGTTALMPLGWTGFLINAISGGFLFSSQATLFIENTPFLTKISLIFIAAISATVIQHRLRASAVSWDASDAVPAAVRGIAVLSLLCWLGAIVAGRLVAYL